MTQGWGWGTTIWQGPSCCLSPWQKDKGWKEQARAQAHQALLQFALLIHEGGAGDLNFFSDFPLLGLKPGQMANQGAYLTYQNRPGHWHPGIPQSLHSPLPWTPALGLGCPSLYNPAIYLRSFYFVLGVWCIFFPSTLSSWLAQGHVYSELSEMSVPFSVLGAVMSSSFISFLFFFFFSSLTSQHLCTRSCFMHVVLVDTFKL